MSLSQEPIPETNKLKVIPDATCTHCGCLCDDLVLSVENNKVVEATNSCEAGKTYFLNQQTQDEPEALIEGKPTTYPEAIDKAVEILLAAKNPLTYGLSETTTEAQRVAVAITDWVGGIIDTTTSIGRGSSGLAIQEVGEVTCSLGEIKNRADFIIYWGANPVKNQPRHLSRYSLLAEGEFLPNGRKDRTAILIDVKKNETAKEMDQFLKVKPGSDFELAWTMRALLKGIDPDPSVEKKTGIKLDLIKNLIDQMKDAKYGAILFGAGITHSPGNQLNRESIHLLTRDLNQFTRWVSRPISSQGNATGADNVLTWSTGYPFAVSMGRGYPRFNPGEFTAPGLLARKEIDAAFMISTGPMLNFTQADQEYLKTIPVIELSSGVSQFKAQPSVSLKSSTYGIHSAGTVYRMDHVSLPLRPSLKSPYKSEFEILKMIEEKILIKTKEK